MLLTMSDRNKSPTNKPLAAQDNTSQIDKANTIPMVRKGGRQVHSPFYSLVLSRGYTDLRQFSRSAKISYSHLTHIICGRYSPRLKTMQQISSALSIDIRRLSTLIAQEVQWRRKHLKVQPSKLKWRENLSDKFSSPVPELKLESGMDAPDDNDPTQ